ncbi:MAG: hypothetical protein LBQ38_11380 [Spirochaetaceae bacterium]|jgi:predicted transposase/invertase (TIGR01784 family)|nr:hypothetical protein [Spirochaetaceae bacterium]
MLLLLPFYLLKMRKALKAAKTREAGLLAGDDVRVVLELTERLYRELYGGYNELKEVDLMLQKELLTYSEEAAIKARKKGRLEGRQEGWEQGIRETARKMKAAGLPPEQIRTFTGLSPEAITDRVARVGSSK